MQALVKQTFEEADMHAVYNILYHELLNLGFYIDPKLINNLQNAIFDFNTGHRIEFNKYFEHLLKQDELITKAIPQMRISKTFVLDGDELTIGDCLTGFSQLIRALRSLRDDEFNVCFKWSDGTVSNLERQRA